MWSLPNERKSTLTLMLFLGGYYKSIYSKPFLHARLVVDRENTT